MPLCFYFKNHLHFPNLNVKTHILTKPKSCLFSGNYFYFYFLSVVGTPMNNCAKYQHLKQKLFLLLKNYKISFFKFFEGLKNGPFKDFFLICVLCFRTYSTVDKQLYQIYSTLDEILQHKPTTDPPPPLDFNKVL